MQQFTLGNGSTFGTLLGGGRLHYPMENRMSCQMMSQTTIHRYHWTSYGFETQRKTIEGEPSARGF